MPLHEAGITLFSGLYGVDFRRQNDLLPKLGLADLSVDELRGLARAGRM